MRLVTILLAIALMSLLSSCTQRATTTPGGFSASGISQPELITKSLFNEKDRTISEEDIQRLLSGRIKIRDTVRKRSG